MSQVSAWANVQTDNGGRGYSADDLAAVVYKRSMEELELKCPGFAVKVIEGIAAQKKATDALEQLRLDLLKIMPGDSGNTAWAAIALSVKAPSVRR
jgi:hypothetical protein